MKIKTWKIWLFFAAFIFITIAIFPSKRQITGYYIASGIIAKARYLLTDLLHDQPHDPRLLRMSSELYQLEGRGEMAIVEFKKSLSGKHISPQALTRMATLYEWNRDPLGALPVWERLAKAYPDDLTAWRKLIEIYRYQNRNIDEGRAIANLVSRWQLNTTAYRDNLLLPIIDKELTKLSHRRLRGAVKSSLFNQLLNRLYVLHVKLLKYRGTGEKPGKIRELLTAFLRVGHAKEAIRIADELDQRSKGDEKHRRLLVSILRNSGFNDEALALVTRLRKKNPDDLSLLLITAAIARDQHDFKTAAESYKRLIASRKDNRKFKQDLAALYLEIPDFPKAVAAYRSLAASSCQRQDIMMMLRAADESSDPALQGQALAAALKLAPVDQEIMRKAAKGYLAINKPAKAYNLYRKLIKHYGARQQWLSAMLQAASYSGRQDIQHQAITYALGLSPNDPEIIARAADDMWRQPSRAFALYRRLYKINGDRKRLELMFKAAVAASRPELLLEVYQLAVAKGWQDKFLLRTAQELTVAGANGDAIKLYKQYLTAHPAAWPVKRKLLTLLLAESRIQEAWPLCLKLYQRQPADEELESQVLKLAAWTDHPRKRADILIAIALNHSGDFNRQMAAALALMDLNRGDEALVFLRRGEVIRPDNAAVHRYLARYYQEQNQPEKMIHELSILHDKKLLRKNELLFLAQALLARHHLDKAQKLLQSAAVNSKLPLNMRLLLAGEQAMSGHKKAAGTTYKQLLNENRGKPRLLLAMADRSLSVEQIGAAQNFYEAVLDIDPKNLAALKGLGRISAWNNDPQGAIKFLRRYNRYKKDDYEAQFMLGELYHENGRAPESFIHYQRSLRLLSSQDKTLGPER